MEETENSSFMEKLCSTGFSTCLDKALNTLWDVSFVKQEA